MMFMLVFFPPQSVYVVHDDAWPVLFCMSFQLSDATNQIVTDILNVAVDFDVLPLTFVWKAQTERNV